MPAPYNPLAAGQTETCSYPCGNPEHDHSYMTAKELDERIQTAKQMPGIAHLILAGPSPTCELCGGTAAPIVGGRHLNPERWCRTASGTDNH